MCFYVFIEEQFGVKHDSKPFHGATMGYDNVSIQARESDVGEVNVVFSCKVRECALDEID